MLRPDSDKRLLWLLLILSFFTAVSLSAMWYVHGFLFLLMLFSVMKYGHPGSGLMGRALGLYLFFQVFPVIFSPYPRGTLISMEHLFAFSMFFIMTQFVEKDKTVRLLLIAYIAGASLSSAYGVARFVLGIDERARAFFGGWSTLAAVSSYALFMSLVFFIKEKKLPYLAAFTLNTAGLIVTMERSRTIAVILLVFLMLVLFYRKKLHIFAAVTIIVFALSPSSFRARFSDTFQMRRGWTSGRDELWSEGWRLFKERPVTGWGRGSIKEIIDYDNISDHGVGNWHNSWLQHLVDSGLPGFIAWVIVIALFFGVYARFAVGLYGRDYLPFILFGCGTMFIIVSFFGSVNYSFLSPRANYMFWGLLEVMRRNKTRVK